MTTSRIHVYVERGLKRTFAGAIDWPGWCRSGKDEAAALQALIDYAERYGRVVARARLGFRAPSDVSALQVVERLRGGATTDFGAPGEIPKADARELEPEDLKRSRALFEACWRAFDDSVRAARGRNLAKGPRGGGRPLLAVVKHVIEADGAYLGGLGWKYKVETTSAHGLAPIRRAMLEGLEASAKGEIPARGPRGGRRWPARFFVRRAAWHVLDHAWEIEDRLR